MAIDFITLNSDSIARLDRTKTVFLIPVGPIEDHGPHLPVGLDGMVAQVLCTRMAKKLEESRIGYTAVMLPLLPIGVESNTSNLTLKVRSHVLRDYLIDTCRALHDQGFLYFICFSGFTGPKQLTAIEEASIWLRRKTGGLFSKKGAILISAMSALVDKRQVMKSPLALDPEEHGGSLDTSIGQVIAPTLVGALFRELPPRQLPKSAWIRNWMRNRGRIESYWGSPALSDPKAGEHWLNETIQTLFPKIQSVLDGKSPSSLFRSWYSVIPVNRSLFRVWVLFWLILVILCVWIFLILGAFDSG